MPKDIMCSVCRVGSYVNETLGCIACAPGKFCNIFLISNQVIFPVKMVALHVLRANQDTIQHWVPNRVKSVQLDFLARKMQLQIAYLAMQIHLLH